jgi:hypothetical protein
MIYGSGFGFGIRIRIQKVNNLFTKKNMKKIVRVKELDVLFARSEPSGVGTSW